VSQYKIIINPAAGRGACGRAVSKVESILKKYGLDFDLAHTEHPWHAAELAREAAILGYDIVVAVGGDGTVNEVLNGLMQARDTHNDACAMGVLCIGQGNDFAQGMGIPLDLEMGCRALSQDHRRKIDIGKVNGDPCPEGRYFGNGIGIGFDAAANLEALKITWLHGFPAYLVAVLKTIFLYYQAPFVAIEYDEQTIELLALLISVMNGRCMGGGFLMAPESKSDDGLFDLCIVREVSRPRIFSLLPHFLRGTQATQSPISTGRARRVVVTATEGTLPVHLDGEPLCADGRRLEIELLPRQIEIIYQPH